MVSLAILSRSISSIWTIMIYPWICPSSDRMRSAPAISMSNRKRNVQAHVGSRSQQQNQPPSHKYGAHPQLVAPDAKSFGKQLRSRSQENVQSDNLDDSTEGPVRSRQPNVAFPKFCWNFRTYLLAERRHHHHCDQDEVEEHSHGLA